MSVDCKTHSGFSQTGRAGFCFLTHIWKPDYGCRLGLPEVKKPIEEIFYDLPEIVPQIFDPDIELYRVYQETPIEAETFDRFIFWRK